MVLGMLQGERKFSYPESRTRKAKGGFRQHLQAKFASVISEGDRRLVIRASIFREPAALVMAILDTVLAHQEREGSGVRADDALLLIERGLRRQIRLRARRDSIEHRRIISQET
jgi:hypothetical protein